MSDLYSQLPQLYIFARVAELGSFQAAAHSLELPRSSVSKRVAQLESALGLRLLQRSTRRLSLTPEGDALLRSAGPLLPLLQQMTSLSQQAHSERGDLRGGVVISCSGLLGERLLIPLLAQMQQVYPGVTVSLRLEDDIVDLIASATDLALRIGELPDSSLVARQVGSKRWGCFASPAYLARAGQPHDPQQLHGHDCITLRTQTRHLHHWQFSDRAGQNLSLSITPAVTASDGRTLAAMAVNGMGIIWGDPAWFRQELQDGQLQEVLSDWRSALTSPIHWISLGKNARNPAVEAVWHWLAERLPGQLSGQV